MRSCEDAAALHYCVPRVSQVEGAGSAMRQPTIGAASAGAPTHTVRACRRCRCPPPPNDPPLPVGWRSSAQSLGGDTTTTTIPTIPTTVKTPVTRDSYCHRYDFR